MIAVLDELVGSRLRSVTYDVLKWDDAPTVKSAVDTVSMAAMFQFDRACLRLRWRSNPPREHLEMEMLGAEERDNGPGVLARRLDVSQRWHPFLGARLLSISQAYQETGYGIEPWATTLVFAGPGELVVALGEVVDGKLSYIPDSLVVIGAREVSSAYRPPAALTSAWTGHM